MRRSISIVIPAYNEEDCVRELCSRLQKVFQQLGDYDFEVILVENGSSDATFSIMSEIAETDARFKIVQLARNFRMDGGITAGLEYVDSDALILMTADLQDPPELIPRLVQEWESGIENVYGVVTRRVGTGPVRRFNSRAFYWLIGKLTGELIPRNASDFRILDRRVYEQIRRMDERNRFVRGLIAWVGFTSKGVEFEREERFAGESKAYSRHVIQLAAKGIMAHSQVPLVLIPAFGAFMFGSSLVALMILILDWLKNGVPFPGFGTIIAVTVMLFGILFLFLGILSMYVGLIYEEVKRRPNFIVSKTVGL